MATLRTARQLGNSSPLLRSPIPRRPEIHQITLPLPSTWKPHDHVQVYLIEGDPLTLIDTGVRTPLSQSVLEAALDGLGFGFEDLERVILTHAHRDHMGLVETLRRAAGDLECQAHVDDADRIERFGDRVVERLDQVSDLFREHGLPEAMLESMHAERMAALEREFSEAEETRVDRRLRDGDRVAFKDFSLRVRHSPGHTPGHILLEDEEEQLLFTGDQVMAHAIPNTETFYTASYPEPGDPLGRRPRFKGLSAMRRSLKQLRGRPFKMLLPGFGGLIRRPERAVRDTLLFYEVRLQRIERGLRHLAAMGQDVTAYDLLKSLYPEDDSAAERRARLLTLIGALDCLEEDGDVRFARRGDGVLTVRHC